MGDPQNIPGKDEQIRRLNEFVQQLQALLQAVVSNPENIIPGRHHDAMVDAWADVKLQFEKIKVTMKDKAGLDRVGLTGRTLIFELAVFSHARDELLDHAPELFSSRVIKQMPSQEQTTPQPQTPSQQQKPVGWWTRLRRLIRGSLKVGDVILGSLGEIPVFGAPAEAIKQYKESVEECVAMSDEVAES
jgi:hypothetical protein